jgi:O-methyltransferase involved in polyketide biosynthesis
MGTVALDFDGPIHQYTSGWRDGSIYDPPTPGAIEAIRDLADQHAVFVHTCRDAEQVAAWLRGLGFRATDRMPRGRFWNQQGELLVTDRKLPALAYVDDRAVRFHSWPQTMTDLAVLLT